MKKPRACRGFFYAHRVKCDYHTLLFQSQIGLRKVTKHVTIKSGENVVNCGDNYPKGVFNQDMNQSAKFHLRLPQQLLTAAQETARQQCHSLPAVLRRYLEAYAASQPTKLGNNPE